MAAKTIETVSRHHRRTRLRSSPPPIVVSAALWSGGLFSRSQAPPVCLPFNAFFRLWSMELFSKDSASDSLVFMGNQPDSRDEPVVVKMFVTGVESGGLEYEVNIYRDVVPALLKRNPSFVEFVLWFQCDVDPYLSQFQEGAKRMDSPKIKREVENMVKYVEKTTESLSYTQRRNAKMTGIVTKMARGVTLHDLIEDEPKKFVQLFWDIYLELFVAIACMHANGLAHNDMHYGNIFVDVRPRSQTRIHLLPGGHLFINPDNRVNLQIYDWDRSFYQKAGLNSNLKMSSSSYCSFYAQCNKNREVQTLHTVLFHLRKAYAKVHRRDFDPRIASFTERLLRTPEIPRALKRLMKDNLPSTLFDRYEEDHDDPEDPPWKYGMFPHYIWEHLEKVRSVGLLLKYLSATDILKHEFQENTANAQLEAGLLTVEQVKMAEIYIEDPRHHPEKKADEVRNSLLSRISWRDRGGVVGVAVKYLKNIASAYLEGSKMSPPFKAPATGTPSSLPSPHKRVTHSIQSLEKYPVGRQIYSTLFIRAREKASDMHEFEWNNRTFVKISKNNCTRSKHCSVGWVEITPK